LLSFPAHEAEKIKLMIGELTDQVKDREGPSETPKREKSPNSGKTWLHGAFIPALHRRELSQR
jgi:hypothetical protein